MVFDSRRLVGWANLESEKHASKLGAFATGDGNEAARATHVADPEEVRALPGPDLASGAVHASPRARRSMPPILSG